jgi:hypothetical protein
MNAIVNSSRSFNAPTMTRLWIVAVVVAVLSVVAFGIYYGLHDKSEVFQQQVQMWVGDNGLIFLGTWILALFAVTLTCVSIRESLPLWLDEFRTWGEFKRTKLGEMIHSWNAVINNPQFSAMLGVINSSVGGRV